MSGRAGCTEGMPCLAVNDHIDCLNDRTYGKTGGRQGVFTDNGVVVQAENLVIFGPAGFQPVQVFARMGKCEAHVADFFRFYGLEVLPNTGAA